MEFGPIFSSLRRSPTGAILVALQIALALAITANSLYIITQRLEAIGVRKVVIGVSGGLDSTHALIVAAKAFERLGLPRPPRDRASRASAAVSDRKRFRGLTQFRRTFAVRRP